MFLYRSLTVGLLGACCFLLLRRPVPMIVQLPIATPSSIAAALPARDPLRVIDVASNAAPDQVAELVKLELDERIVSVDDDATGDPVVSLLHVMSSAARKEPGHRDFIDLTIRGAAGERRVLLLMH